MVELVYPLNASFFHRLACMRNLRAARPSGERHPRRASSTRVSYIGWTRAGRMQEQERLVKEQDEQLESLGQGVSRVKALAGVMKNELDEQAVILDRLEDDVERTDSSMRSMQKRLGSLLEQAKSSDRALWSVIGCLLVLLAVLTFLVLS